MPWVKSAKYLGNIITNMVSGLNKDVRSKRAMFIEKNGKILQEFSFAHPQVKFKINTIYNSSFTGCVLWDFSSENVHQLVNSWSVATRHICDLPRESNRYFIKELGGVHAQTMLYARFVTFIQWIRKNPKFPDQFLLNLIKDNIRATEKWLLCPIM